VYKAITATFNMCTNSLKELVVYPKPTVSNESRRLSILKKTLCIVYSMNKNTTALLLIVCITFFYVACRCRESFEQFAIARKYANANIPNAYNGVIVGKEHFYAIHHNSISKHKISSGNVVNTYNISNKRIVNMVGGAIVYGELYICNSNENAPNCRYNTIEVFDLDMNHKYFVEVKGVNGSLVGIDYYNHTWWACVSSQRDDSTRTTVCELYSPRPSLYDVNENSIVQDNRYEPTASAYENDKFPELPVNVNIQVRNNLDIVVDFTESSKNDVYNKNVYYAVYLYTNDPTYTSTVVDGVVETVETFAQVSFEAIGDHVYSTRPQTSSPIIIPLSLPYIKENVEYSMILMTSFDKEMLAHSSMHIGTHVGGTGIVVPKIITYLDDKDAKIAYRSKYILSSGGPTSIKDTCAFTPSKYDITKWTVRNRYYMPNEYVNGFIKNPANGFSIGPNGKVYVTNNTHDMFVLHINRSSPNLILDDVLHLDITFHGIDWHKTSRLLYGINGESNEVVVYDGNTNI